MNTGTHYNLLLSDDERSKDFEHDFTAQKKNMMFIFAGVMGTCMVMVALASPSYSQPQLKSLAMMGYGNSVN